MTGSICGGGKSRDLNAVGGLPAALRRHLERPQRFDFIVEQFDANRQQPIGCENVDNAAAVRKLAWQLDGARRVKSMLDQPAQQLVDVDPITLVQRSCRRANRIRRWRRLEQRLDRCDDDPRTEANVEDRRSEVIERRLYRICGWRRFSSDPGLRTTPLRAMRSRFEKSGQPVTASLLCLFRRWTVDVGLWTFFRRGQKLLQNAQPLAER